MTKNNPKHLTLWRASIAVCSLCMALAACGSNAPRATLSAPNLQDSRPLAAGPVSSACVSQSLRRTSVATCGCIQSAANATMNATDQKRAARFFGNPELLQEMKLSDSPKNERFWDLWAKFAETAENMCEN